MRNPLAFLLPFLALTLLSAAALRADEKKVLAALEAGEKALQGRRRSFSRAERYFETARKQLEAVRLKAHLEARIAHGMARALLGRRKYAEACAEVAGLARTYGRKFIPSMAFGSAKVKDWAARLKALQKRIEGGDANEAARKELEALASELAADRMGGTYRLAAAYLLGLWHETAKKPKEAVPHYLEVVEAYRKRLDAEAARKKKAEASRPRTPEKLPRAPRPPGKLRGACQKAVEKALDWLARHQCPDGRWDEDELSSLCGPTPCPEGRTKVRSTGFSHALALLAMARAGVTTGHDGHGQAFRKAVAYAVGLQTPAGLLARTQFESTMETALFTRALAEVEAAEPGLPGVRKAVEKGVQYLLSAQNPGWGWRYGIRPGDNGTEHTAAALLALARARSLGLSFPRAALDGGMHWINRVTDEVTGRTGAFSKGGQGAVMANARTFRPVDSPTARALAARLVWKADPEKDELARRGFDILWHGQPAWEEERSIYYSYWNDLSLAYALKGGKDAAVVLSRLADLLVEHQEEDGCARGSWPSIGAFSSHGRIVSTALGLLAVLNTQAVALPPAVDPEELPDAKEENSGGK